MRAYFWVAAGGAIGSVLRALIAMFMPLQHNFHIVWINVIGSLLLAIIFTSLSSNKPSDERLRWLLGIGLMGGFTTMSTFTLDLVLLLESGQLGSAAAYLMVSVIGGGLAATLGIMVTKAFKRGNREA